MANEQGEDVDEGEAMLTGAASGAAAGSVAGPYGALAGGIIGAGIGLFGALSQEEAAKKARRARDEALYKASVLKDIASRQKESLRSTGRELGATKPKGVTDQPSAIPTGATPTSGARTGAIGSGISSSGTF